MIYSTGIQNKNIDHACAWSTQADFIWERTWRWDEVLLETYWDVKNVDKNAVITRNADAE